MKIKDLERKSFKEAFLMASEFSGVQSDYDFSISDETKMFYLDDGQVYFDLYKQTFKTASLFRMSELIDTGNKILESAGLDCKGMTWQDIPKNKLSEIQINLIHKLTDLMYAVEEAQISDWN